jgi:hypothetical protein
MGATKHFPGPPEPMVHPRRFTCEPGELVVLAVVLTVTTVASLLKARKDPTARAHAGSLRGHPDQDRPAG